MTRCHVKDQEWLDYLTGDLEEPRKSFLASHLEECSDCRRVLREMSGVLAGAGSFREEIEEARRAVDWERLAARITEVATGATIEPAPRRSAGRFQLWPRVPRLGPVLAALVLGLGLGSLGTYLALRAPGPGPERSLAFQASQDFLERAELEVARRATLDYLERSEYLLLDFVGTPGSVPLAASGRQAKELLSKKKYLNSQLTRVEMAKAKAICDQIEMLFQELAQVGQALPAAELQKIQSMIVDRQLLLKINIVKKELESEV
jgi:hypothetical protein